MSFLNCSIKDGIKQVKIAGMKERGKNNKIDQMKWKAPGHLIQLLPIWESG